jgi:spore coat protein U-like protein
MTLRFSTRIACAAVLAASFGLTGSAFSASKTGTLNVKLTIEDGCSVFSNNTNISLDFGTWTTLSQNIDGETQFQVACTGKTGFTVSLDKGLAGASTDNRLLKNTTTTTAAPIAYNLYAEPARGTPWGSKTLTKIPDATSPAGKLETVKIYGRVFESTTIPVAGTYTDTVTITLASN